MVPPDASCTDQVTAWSAAPATVAVNGWVRPVWSAAVGGETLTRISVDDRHGGHSGGCPVDDARRDHVIGAVPGGRCRRRRR